MWDAVEVEPQFLYSFPLKCFIIPAENCKKMCWIKNCEELKTISRTSKQAIIFRNPQSIMEQNAKSFRPINSAESALDGQFAACIIFK